MKLKTNWTEKMQFAVVADQHSLTMDTKPPIGNDTGLTPKQLLVAAICGCTGMDIVSLLKKYKQPLESFSIEAEASLSESGHPVVFKEARLIFQLTGAMEKDKVLEAVKLSQTKYCSVSAMLSKAFPIHYTIELNSEKIGEGKADFSN